MKQFPKHISTKKFLQKKQAELKEQCEDELCHHREQIVKLLNDDNNNKSDDDNNDNDDNKSDDDNDSDKADDIADEHTSITYLVSEEYDYNLCLMDNYIDKKKYICSTIVEELKKRGFNAAYKEKDDACTNCCKVYFKIYIWTTYPPNDYYR